MRSVGAVVTKAVAFTIALVATAACGDEPAGAASTTDPRRRDAQAAPPPPDASPAPAVPAVRPGALVPVIALDGEPYLELDAWFELERAKGDVTVTWGDGPTAEVKLGPAVRQWLALLLQPAPKAPAPWHATTGATIPGYTATGAACPATLGAPMILGQGMTGTIDTAGYDDESPPRMVAPLRATGCRAVVATAGPPPRFYAVGAPSAAERKALLAAWKRHPERAEAGDLGKGRPTIQRLTAAGASPLALLTREHDASAPDACGSQYAALRALYTLPASGPPVLLASSHAVFDDAPLIAALARPPTDGVTLIYGAHDLDFGMSGHRVPVGAVTMAPTTNDLYAVGFTRYVGCD